MAQELHIDRNICGIDIVDNDGSPVVIIAEHQLQGEGNAHLRISLCWFHDKYVTWDRNMSSGGSFSTGHYFSPRSFDGGQREAMKAATADFIKRVARAEFIALDSLDA